MVGRGLKTVIETDENSRVNAATAEHAWAQGFTCGWLVPVGLDGKVGPGEDLLRQLQAQNKF